MNVFFVKSHFLRKMKKVAEVYRQGFLIMEYCHSSPSFNCKFCSVWRRKDEKRLQLQGASATRQRTMEAGQ